MGLMTEHLLKREEITEDDAVKMRIAALLHDIGHYPFSHLGESVYSYCKDNENASNIIEAVETKQRPLHELASAHSTSAHHEQLGKYIVVNNESLASILNKNGLDPVEIGEILLVKSGPEIWYILNFYIRV